MRKIFFLKISILIFLFTFGTLWPTTKAEALCIKEKRANLRKGPGLHYEKLWEVFRYMPFRQLSKKGEWVRIKDLDGDVYWVHKRLTTTSLPGH